jgi:hypothetical protein
VGYTLADYARTMKDPLKAGVVDVFRRESFIMEYLKWETIDTLVTQQLRTKTLPTVEWRKINETWTGSSATVEPVEDRVFDMGGKVDVDKLLIKSKSVTDQRALQSDAYVTALAYEFNNTFINGDFLVDGDQFTGLWRRIKDWLPTGQTITNSTGLDISPDASGLSANFDQYLDKLQELIHAVEGHKPDCLVMNDTLYLRTLSALRQKGLYATTEDSYGRTISTYGPGGPKILDIGYKADQANRIIGNVELADGTAITGGGSTSVYALRLGEKFLQGIQLYDMDVKDKGELEDGVTYRTVIDWPVGITLVNPRSIGRMIGVIAA